MVVAVLPSRGRYTPVAVELGLTFGGGGPTASARRAANAAIDDENALVAAVSRGDSRALEQIYERYARGVYSLALRLLGDGPGAEEIVQETFLKLWRQPSAYQPARVSRALGTLPAEQRMPIELAYYRGLTQVEIAERLSLPLGTVKTRMRLGLQQLRKAPELSLLWSER
jgi:RNA polymerase sigma-70 factor (ECF subfamily)